MPTWERTDRFDHDWHALGTPDRERFRRAVRHFVADPAIRALPARAPGRVQGTTSIFEMTWAPDGRATFQFGPTRESGPHLIWRRIVRASPPSP